MREVQIHVQSNTPEGPQAMANRPGPIRRYRCRFVSAKAQSECGKFRHHLVSRLGGWVRFSTQAVAGSLAQAGKGCTK